MAIPPNPRAQGQSQHLVLALVSKRIVIWMWWTEAPTWVVVAAGSVSGSLPDHEGCQDDSSKAECNISDDVGGEPCFVAHCRDKGMGLKGGRQPKKGIQDDGRSETVE
jgi:hypothetical protein